MGPLEASSIRPSVAVLLATYNGEAHCDAQIASLLWQRGLTVHVYARDDGSRDATPRIVADWAKRYPDQITIIPSDGVATGSATGNFFALLAAVNLDHHDYVAFADQDDVWTPDKLNRAVSCLVGHSADGYSSDLIAYDPSANNVWLLHKAGHAAELDYLFQGGSAGCTYVLSKAAAALVTQTVRGAPPLCRAASHDWIIYAICRSHGLRWWRDPTAEILYRQHGENDYGAKRGIADIRDKLRLTRSRWYRNHILWLNNVIVGTAAERDVLRRVERSSIGDRIWLIARASRFRRSRRFILQLRIAIALGMI